MRTPTGPDTPAPFTLNKVTTMTSDYALESLSEGDRIEMQADADAYDHFLASEELAALEAQALEAAQRAEEWAAFEEDMQTAYPWPSQQEIDEREAA